MPAAKKVTHNKFQLSTQNGRVALLTGVVAGVVGMDEVEYAVVQDTEKRPHKKPVVVPWHTGGEQRFHSVRDAAKYLLTVESRKSYIPKGIEYTLALQRIEKRIARYCNADNVPHYYWSE